jgi:DNA-binding response OmpR family regulator
MAPLSLIPPAALLVDGDEQSRRVVAGVLAENGYGRVWEADSVGAALKCFDEPWFDLAVVDLRFSEDEGYNLISLLRSRAGTVGRIIAIAGDDDEGLRELTLRRGADVVLARPLDLTALSAACLVERRSAPRADWTDGLRLSACG